MFNQGNEIDDLYNNDEVIKVGSNENSISNEFIGQLPSNISRPPHVTISRISKQIGHLIESGLANFCLICQAQVKDQWSS
jgi:hypothetical protein